MLKWKRCGDGAWSVLFCCSFGDGSGEDVHGLCLAELESLVWSGSERAEWIYGGILRSDEGDGAEEEEDEIGD